MLTGIQGFRVLTGEDDLLTLRGYTQSDFENGNLYQLIATKNKLILNKKENSSWVNIWEIDAKLTP